MIKTTILADGRTRTWSDIGMMIRQIDTNILYEDAVDTLPHTYEETNEPIPSYDEDATSADYEAALNRMGVET